MSNTEYERLDDGVIVTNTPRAGETPEQIAARSAPRNGTPMTDPGVTEVEAMRKRTADMVENIMNNTLKVLTQRRDALDTCMERIRVSGRALGHYIGEFAARNHEAIQLASEIEKLTTEAMLPFAKDPPATITQSPLVAKPNGDSNA